MLLSKPTKDVTATHPLLFLFSIFFSRGTPTLFLSYLPPHPFALLLSSLSLPAFLLLLLLPPTLSFNWAVPVSGIRPGPPSLASQTTANN